MGRLDYAKLFFLGKKSDNMKSIEKRFPTLDKFSRLGSFFHAFGNHDFTWSWGWIIILPARHNFEYNNSKNMMQISLGVISLYVAKWRRKKAVKLIEL